MRPEAELPLAGAGPKRATGARRRNVLAYAVSLGTVLATSTGAYGNAEVSARYPTLLTPAAWICAIWPLIFLAEGVAVFFQLLPRYRCNRLVEISSPWWQLACLCHACWCVALAQDVMWLSVVFILGVLAALVGLTLRANHVALSWDEYVFLFAPYVLHMSWVACALAVNVSILAVSCDAPPEKLLALAIVSLAGIGSFTAYFVTGVRHPEPIVPFVVALMFAAIAKQLTEARNLRDARRFHHETWPEDVLRGLRTASVVLNAISGTASILAGAWRLSACLRRPAEAEQRKAPK